MTINYLGGWPYRSHFGFEHIMSPMSSANENFHYKLKTIFETINSASRHGGIFLLLHIASDILKLLSVI